MENSMYFNYNTEPSAYPLSTEVISGKLSGPDFQDGETFKVW